MALKAFAVEIYGPGCTGQSIEPSEILLRVLQEFWSSWSTG